MSERVLFLTLKARWYDLIESGEKKEEYREVKPYWQSRLDGHQYDVVVFSYGYTRRRMAFRCNGIRKGTGNPAWGAVKGKEYWVISLGERVR